MDPQELREIFATNLRVARAARRLSQEALAVGATLRALAPCGPVTLGDGE